MWMHTAGNRKQETGNRKQETGNRKQESGFRAVSGRRPCSLEHP
jgi:hypothetical protein